MHLICLYYIKALLSIEFDVNIRMGRLVFDPLADVRCLFVLACHSCVFRIVTLVGLSLTLILFISVASKLTQTHTSIHKNELCPNTERLLCWNDCCCKCYLSLAGCKQHVVCVLSWFEQWLSSFCDFLAPVILQIALSFKPLRDTDTSMSCTCIVNRHQWQSSGIIFI